LEEEWRFECIFCRKLSRLEFELDFLFVFFCMCFLIDENWICKNKYIRKNPVKLSQYFFVNEILFYSILGVNFGDA
jgi:hypothetical protein